jgi:hypothetical protein
MSIALLSFPINFDPDADCPGRSRQLFHRLDLARLP